MRELKLVLLCLIGQVYGIAQHTALVADSTLVLDIGNEGSTIGTPTNTGAVDTSFKVSFWVHGAGGGYSSWAKVAAVTENQSSYLGLLYPARNTRCFVMDYDSREQSGENLQEIATGMVHWMRLQLVGSGLDSIHSARNIAIAHSQGGLVGRNIRYMTETDSRYNESFGALATFGTPHLGALIANSSVTGGPTQRWLTDGCQALSSAELNTIIGSSWWLSTFISASLIQDITGQACRGLRKSVFPLLLSNIRRPVANDYRIGAAELALLDSFARVDSMPLVAFVGVEKEPVLWRMVHSMSTTTDTTLSGSILAQNPFGLNNDDGLAIHINHKISSYDAKRRAAARKARTNSNWLLLTSVWNGGAFLYLYDQKINAQRSAEIYKNAGIWLENANPTWKRLIGARTDSTYVGGYLCQCDFGLGNNLYLQQISHPSQCPSPCNLSPILHQVTIDEPNDGLVTVSSQRSYPGYLADWQFMTETNHMQERNCAETRDRLRELFDGDYGKQFTLGKL